MPRKNQTRRKLPAVEKLKEQIAATQALLRVPGYSLYGDPEEPQRLGRYSVELECFLWNWGDYKRDPREVNGLGTTRHFVNAASINWTDLEWNPWLLRGIASIFDVPYRHDGTDGRWAKFIGWAGCAAAGKTYTAGVAAYQWWSADPLNSICIFTSTTREMSRRRVWPVFQHLHQTAKYQQGYLQESRTMIQSEKGDDKNAIYAMAVAKGETATAVANLKGVHAPRVMLIIDEAEGTPEAIFQTIPNIRKGCSKQFIVICIGNPVSHLDNLGRYCEPLAGWDNVTVEHEQWPTKGVRAWQVDPGLCVHFDGAKSPNVVEQRTIYPYLYAWEDWQNAQKSKGERTASFWSQDRGFWSPIGVENTIFSEPMVEQYGGYETNFVFRGWSRHLAFLDPAFGGDQCKLVHAVVGDADDGRHVIEILEQVNLAGDVEKQEELDYQIARQAIEYAKGWGVEPSGFGLDATGTGRGVAAIIAAEWSTGIHRVEFGGAPSDKIASDNDPRPSHEVYDRRVTELWYSCREMLRGRQLKGLYPDAVIQFCHREFRMLARKVKLDTKEECKEKIGRSPDDADAIAGVVEVARELGAVAITGAVDRGNREWDKTVEDAHDIYNPDLAYSEPIGRQFDPNPY